MKKLFTDGGVLLATNKCKSGARMLKVNSVGCVPTASKAVALGMKPRLTAESSTVS
jgi:hypothetical protein